MLKNILTVLRKLASAAMNFLIVYFETIAVPMSWAMGGTIMFTMYTELSNIFNGAVCLLVGLCSWAASSPGGNCLSGSSGSNSSPPAALP